MAAIHSEAQALSPTFTGDSLTTLPLQGSDIVSIKDLSLAHIQKILTAAQYMKKNRPDNILKNKIIGHFFFEPSTRTRLSFEVATLRLGGNVIGFSNDEATSLKKGESLHDTIKVISRYADLLIIRHYSEGSARLAADLSDKPVINAGDGANQHPTQTLTDLFTIQECQQKLDGLSIALAGDLKHARTIHSLAQACVLFDIRLFLVSTPSFTMPENICNTLKNAGVRFSFHHSLEEVIPKVDILYMTRLQHERFHAGSIATESLSVLTPALLANAKPNLKILQPLPRLSEIDVKVDAMPQAHYFAQAENGIYVRQALLSLLLNEAAL